MYQIAQERALALPLQIFLPIWHVNLQRQNFLSSLSKKTQNLPAKEQSVNAEMLQWKKSINLITNVNTEISIHKAQRHWSDHISVLGLHHYLILFVPSYNDVSEITQCPELLRVWQASVKVEEALCCLPIPALPSGCCKELHLFTPLAAKATTFRAVSAQFLLAHSGTVVFQFLLTDHLHCWSSEVH